MPITIHVEDLGKRFNREWIFRKLNSTFQPGKVYAITGPNGSGKSTLMQVLWGQSPPSAGNIMYRNSDKPVEVEKIYQHISVATPYMDLIDEFTLGEQLQFHFKLRSSRKGMSQDEILDRIYLRSSKDKYIGNFSSGMKQRVKLGLAFFTQGDIIFLDEPGTNLDKQAFEWYQSELKNLPPQCTVFIASNNAMEYPENADIIDILQYK